MLKGSNDKVLINRGVKAVIVSFYQRWQELMHKKTLDIVLVNNCVGFSLSPFYGTQKVIAYDYPMKCEVIIT